MIDNPRLDLLVARYGRTLVVALTLLGILALAASGWAVATPHTERTTQQVGEDPVGTTVHTSALVVEDGLWERGTELSDSSVYVLEASPELTIEPRTTVSGDASVTHDVAIRYDAVRDDDDEDPFWTRTDPLIRDEPGVEDGVAASEATIDVEAVLDERRELEERISGIGSIDVTLVVVTTYDTGTNEGELSVETPFQVSEQAYWLEEPTPSDSDPNVEHGTVEHTEPRSSLLVGLLALLGAASLGSAWAFSRRPTVDEEAARRAVHERRYAEWISHGSIPMWIGDHHVSLDTLEDVVDVAIDTNERVVHDRQRGLFAVVSDDVVYYYTDRGLWEETAWPDIDLGGKGPADGAEASPIDGSTAESIAENPSQAQRPEGAPPETGHLPDPDDEDAWRRI